MKTVITHTPEETMALAAKLAAALKEGDLIALVGELGAGKTMFVKGLAKGLGVAEPLYVNSPSFVVMKEYHGDKDLYHFDIYRLDLRSFAETVDYERYFYGKGVTAVEWADRIKDLLPEDHLEVRVEYGEGYERKFTITPVGKRFENISV
jgi:tRNA threonylcarbamoyladenosine biosynthesis protein TsaE